MLTTNFVTCKWATFEPPQLHSLPAAALAVHNQIFLITARLHILSSTFQPSSQLKIIIIMLRLQISPIVPFLAVFLFLVFVGTSSNTDDDSSYLHVDRADPALLAYRNDGHHRGLKYLRSPTGTQSTPPLSTGTSPAVPVETCFNPPISQVVTGVDADELCQCPPSTYYRGKYYTLDYGYNGQARCEATLVPIYSNQTRVVGNNNSFIACMTACVGSFDKKKRGLGGDIIEARQYSPYWFCHGVNFIQDELCEFIGAVSHYDFPTPGVRSWDNGLTYEV